MSAFIEHARVLGASETQWPRAMRERIFGRVMGRVLAHEIGHFVLGTPGTRRTDSCAPRSAWTIWRPRAAADSS
ncbi:MAG: hypothetical protein HY048_13420 [Acidobacteria bacterium]|nr:hypothetical protein [Acidobacteriota bacterium]